MGTDVKSAGGSHFVRGIVEVDTGPRLKTQPQTT